MTVVKPSAWNWSWSTIRLAMSWLVLLLTTAGKMSLTSTFAAAPSAAVGAPVEGSQLATVLHSAFPPAPVQVCVAGTSRASRLSTRRGCLVFVVLLRRAEKLTARKYHFMTFLNVGEYQIGMNPSRKKSLFGWAWKYRSFVSMNLPSAYGVVIPTPLLNLGSATLESGRWETHVSHLCKC